MPTRPQSASSGRVDTWWFKNEGQKGGAKPPRPSTARPRATVSPTSPSKHLAPWEKPTKKLSAGALQASVERLYGGHRPPRPASAPPRPTQPPRSPGPGPGPYPGAPGSPEPRRTRPYSALPRSLYLSQPRWKPKQSLRWDEEEEMVSRLARYEPPSPPPKKKATTLTHEWNSVAGKYYPKMVPWKEKTTEENTEYLRNFYYEQLKKIDKTRKKLYDKYMQPLTRNKKVKPEMVPQHEEAMERLYKGKSAHPRKNEL